MPQPLCDALRDKIHEQIDRTEHLIGLMPAESPQDALVAHLLDCVSGFCAALYGARPDRLQHFLALRGHPATLPVYRAHIDQAFALLTDADLARKIPTVFVPAGETLLTLLLGNLEHLINHKHELFTVLKRSGVPVATPDLYRLRS